MIFWLRAPKKSDYGYILTYIKVRFKVYPWAELANYLHLNIYFNIVLVNRRTTGDLLSPFRRSSVTLLAIFCCPSGDLLSPFRRSTVTLPAFFCHPSGVLLSPFRRSTVTGHPSGALLSPFRHSTVTLPAIYCHPSGALLSPFRRSSVALPALYSSTISYHPSGDLL